MEPDPSQSRRPAEPAPADDPRLEALRHLIGIVDRLRAPDGCAWDREQTLASMAPHLIEEAHELLDAIESGPDAAIAEEAGDVLMNVALIARIAQDHERFDLGRVAGDVAEKLVRRHPHVFGDVEAGDPEQALASWEASKRRERGESAEDPSALAGIPRGLAALQRAARTAAKAGAAGFRWQSAAGALEQLRLEVEELAEVLAAAGVAREGAGEPGATATESSESAESTQSTEPRATAASGLAVSLEGELARRAEEELGDVLFAGACLGAYLGLDPEAACRAAVRRFEARFRRLEADLDRPLGEVPLTELIERWRHGRGPQQTAPGSSDGPRP